MNFFFEENETISYNKMQQVAHIDYKVERLQVVQARAGSWAPRGGSVIHYRAYETICTIEGERGGVRKKSINA